MGTKKCMYCPAEWKYEGTQEGIVSVCQHCQEGIDRAYTKKRPYRRSIMNYPYVRKFVQTQSLPTRAKCLELLEILRKHDHLSNI